MLFFACFDYVYQYRLLRVLPLLLCLRLTITKSKELGHLNLRVANLLPVDGLRNTAYGLDPKPP